MSQEKPEEHESSSLRARLQAALMPALRSRDDIAVSALRSTLAALGNAEAVEVGASDQPAATLSEHVAGPAPGGHAEVSRVELSEDDVRQVVATEAAEREEAASHYASGGFARRADRLRAEAAVIRTFLA
jgi:uncharacterized protein YqeY